jgi:hypothetical protein
MVTPDTTQEGAPTLADQFMIIAKHSAVRNTLSKTLLSFLKIANDPFASPLWKVAFRPQRRW